eukprot:4099202-Prymnesium_polylepis.2
MAAGAEGNVNYSNDMILRRAALRSDKTVLAALEYVWTALSEMDAEHDGTMSFEEYISMSRRLYLVLRMEEWAESEKLNFNKAMQRELLLDPHDCMDTIDDDFAEDAKGKDYIDKEDFFDSFFQLADLYTDGASATEYAKWMYKRVHQIAAKYTGPDSELLATPEWEWRRDAEIIGTWSSRLQVNIPVFSRLEWEVYFDTRLRQEREESNTRIQLTLENARDTQLRAEAMRLSMGLKDKASPSAGRRVSKRISGAGKTALRSHVLANNRTASGTCAGGARSLGRQQTLGCISRRKSGALTAPTICIGRNASTAVGKSDSKADSQRLASEMEERKHLLSQAKQVLRQQRALEADDPRAATSTSAIIAPVPSTLQAVARPSLTSAVAVAAAPLRMASVVPYDVAAPGSPAPAAAAITATPVWPREMFPSQGQLHTVMLTENCAISGVVTDTALAVADLIGGARSAAPTGRPETAWCADEAHGISDHNSWYPVQA